MSKTTAAYPEMIRWEWTAYCGDENTQDEQGVVEAPCQRSAVEEVMCALGSIIGWDEANDCLMRGDVYIREER